MHSLCCVNVYIYICVCVCVCVCIYIYIYIYITVNNLVNTEIFKLEAPERVFCILVLNEQYETHFGLPVKCPMLCPILKSEIS